MSDILVVIPVFNHDLTLRRVAEDVLAVHPHLLVVDDGSECPVASLLNGLKLNLVRHENNLGKGAAITTAARWGKEAGFTHIVTLDADGQHDPADLPSIFTSIVQTPGAFIIGCRNLSVARAPIISRFGCRFSEFWMYLETGLRIRDMQSGYRAYPVAALNSLKVRDKGYSFEYEVVVKAAWSGLDIIEVPVAVTYCPPEGRSSHFHIIRDNWRMTLLNVRLVIRALIPVPFNELSWDTAVQGISVIRPWQSLKKMMADRATAGLLALSTMVSILVCVLPILGFQSLLILWLIAFFKLNRPWTLAVTHACVPPLMPAYCIEVGYRINHGQWLTGISWQILGREAGERFWDWLVGAAVGGPVLALALALPVFLLSVLAGRHLRVVSGDV